MPASWLPPLFCSAAPQFCAAAQQRLTRTKTTNSWRCSLKKASPPSKACQASSTPLIKSVAHWMPAFRRTACWTRWSSMREATIHPSASTPRAVSRAPKHDSSPRRWVPTVHTTGAKSHSWSPMPHRDRAIRRTGWRTTSATRSTHAPPASGWTSMCMARCSPRRPERFPPERSPSRTRRSFRRHHRRWRTRHHPSRSRNRLGRNGCRRHHNSRRLLPGLPRSRGPHQVMTAVEAPVVIFQRRRRRHRRWRPRRRHRPCRRHQRRPRHRWHRALSGSRPESDCARRGACAVPMALGSTMNA